MKEAHLDPTIDERQKGVRNRDVLAARAVARADGGLHEELLDVRSRDPNGDFCARDRHSDALVVRRIEDQRHGRAPGRHGSRRHAKKDTSSPSLPAIPYNREGPVKTRSSTTKARWGTRSICAALVASVVLTLSPSVRALSLDPEGTDWEGLADLVTLARTEMGRDRVVTPRRLDLEELGPTDALLIIHPMTKLDAREIESFVGDGGRVALLDDYGTGSDLLDRFGIQRVPLPSNPARMLRSNPSLALAEAPEASRSSSDGPQFLRESGPVVTNHATGLGDTGLPPLLVVHGRGEPDVTLAVAGTFGRGRFLAISDSSVAMNAMLRFPGNRALAIALIGYLSEETASTSRHGRLYVLANDAALAGELGTSTQVPRPVHAATVEALDVLRQGLPPTAAYGVAVGVGLGIILWASSRAGRTYKESVPRFVRPIPVAKQGGFAGKTASLSAGSPRIAIVELRRALEEQIGIRLGLDRPAPHRELVARARARGMLGESDAKDLDRIFAALRLAGDEPKRRWPPMKRLKRAEIVALVERSRDLLAAMDGGRRDRLPAST